MDKNSIRWLLDTAGPIIRFRTIVDLLQSQDVELVTNALKQFHSSPTVRSWLEHLKYGFHVDRIWSDSPESFENSIGKLVQLGMRAGLQPFDTLCLGARAWLTDTLESSKNPRITKTIVCVANHLSLAGYSETHYVDKILKLRLDFLNDQQAENMKGKLMISRPSWLDLVGVFHSKPILTDSVWRYRAETLMENIVNGGSIVLPRPEIQPTTLILLETLVHSQTIREGEWLKTVMEKIEKYKTEDGHYKFPERALPEQRRGKWIEGAFMAFDERASVHDAIKCESTFRVLQVMNIIKSEH